MPDLVECMGCAHLKLKGAPLARHGFGNCELQKPSTHVSIARPIECRRHEPAPAAIVDKRREWWASVQNPRA